MEVWLDIAEFENKYRISSKGQVMSLNYNNTGKPKILKPKVNKQGHLEVTLNKDNKHYYRLVSRLVFETFTGIKLGKNDILMYHDNNKENPALDNMYLITRGDRQEITYDLERRYVPKHEFYGEMLTTKELSRIAGVEAHIIRDRLNKLKWGVEESAEIPIAKMGRRSVG
jgi:hypothetical protein